MKKFFNSGKWSSITIILLVSAIIFTSSCNKDEEELPTSSEVINVISPDSTTVFASAGSVINFDLFLATDAIIDTFRAGYYIDTAQIDSNLTFLEVDTIFLSEGFVDSSNTQSIIGSVTLPDSVTNVRAFKPYFPGLQNPFVPEQYDAVRIIFRVESRTNTFEKQLKVIIQ